MAQLTITVADADVPRIMAAYGYDASLGLTQAEFLRRALMRWLVQQVQQYELRAAQANVAAPGPIGVT